MLLKNQMNRITQIYRDSWKIHNCKETNYFQKIADSRVIYIKCKIIIRNKIKTNKKNKNKLNKKLDG